MDKFKKIRITVMSLYWNFVFLVVNPVFASITLEDGQIVISSGGDSIASGQTTLNGAFGAVLDTARQCVSGVTAIFAVTLVGIFAYKAYRLSAVSNPNKRAEAVNSIMYTLMGAALMGGASIFTGLAYQLLR